VSGCHPNISLNISVIYHVLGRHSDGAKSEKKKNFQRGYVGGLTERGVGGNRVTLFELGIFIPAPVSVFEGGGIVLHNYHTTSNN